MTNVKSGAVQSVQLTTALTKLVDAAEQDEKLVLGAEEAQALYADRNELRAALQRIADNSKGLIRRVATQALEGKYE